jgi:DNA-binding NtrC family response regulator
MAEQQLSQRTGEAATSQSPCRLLVIDDDISICEVIEKLAEKVGFAVVRAVSVDEAARHLRESHFDSISVSAKTAGSRCSRFLRTWGTTRQSSSSADHSARCVNLPR